MNPLASNLNLPDQPQVNQRVTTTDDTVTECGSFTLGVGQGVLVVVEFAAVEAGGVDQLIGINRAAVFRNGAGIATLLGAVENTFVRASGGAGGWNTGIFVTGNDVRVSVQGDPATTITWRARMTITPAI